jgi:hypothetical protein
MRAQSVAVVAAWLCGAALALTGCSSASSDWNKASNANTVAAYQDFLASHPDDQHATEAKAFILQLQDDGRWGEAQHAGTTAAYQAYLEQFPQGSHASAAHEAMTSLDRAAAWKTAQAEGSAAGIEAYLQKYPTGPEAQRAKDRLKELTGYRVHLATESSKQKAERKFAQLKVRFAEQLRGLTMTADASGKSFSIDSAGMTKEEAENACGAVKRKHEACQVIQQ